MRFPVDLRLYRRSEEVARWEEVVHKHFPEQAIPTTKKERAKLHKVVDPVLLEDPAFQALHVQFDTKIALAIALVRKAVARKLPFRVVLFDRWYLAQEGGSVLAELHNAWVSMLKHNRNLETNSFVLKDAAGAPIHVAGPPIKGEDLVPHIPASAYRAARGGSRPIGVLP